ncbi:capsule assembly Wzi family protein [Mucilaginibacter flavidus]|uniref:capsule assembly Wzi family protein n=1 Tax=Mucilaginibacter flavidus TaxID=2949309 RepID=UPI002093D54D|nr:capsule assembly Wzi family protein [Mucilaginibacter flavidus]MCO5950325.1 capsule assembly Wzi family protein [Mucilaginibacter flavidus]
MPQSFTDFLKSLLKGILFLFCGSLYGQTVPVGTPVIEDMYRRQQLLGKLDSSISFTIRPLYPGAAFRLDDGFDPDKSFAERGLVKKGIYETGDGKGLVKILPVTWVNQYNTHNPYGWNDGSLIPAAGYQTLFSAGVYAKYSFFSIQFSPEFLFAQNKAFDGFKQAANGSTAWKAWYGLYNQIDAPERFGTSAYTKLLPGQSSIRITFDPLSFGLSTENLWWGPGVQNSLLMSNTARGFAHLTLNTTRPVKTPIGSFETQVIAGKLNPSGYSPQVPGQPGNMVALYKPKPNDWRYLSGFVFTYHPKWVPGLFLGAERVFQVYHNDMGHKFGDYLPFFTSLLRDSFYDPNTGIVSEDVAKRDQLAAVFARWLWTGGNAEIYFEYGREDHNWDARDFLLDPEHSRAYTMGFRKIFGLDGRPDEQIQVGFETTQLATPSDDVVNRKSGYWYAHSQVRAGYTNYGEVIGAGIGPGSGLQTLSIDWISGIKRIGLQFQRYEHNADLYYAAFAAGETRRHWVDYSGGISGDWDFDNILLSASLLYVRELNYEWKFKADPDLSYYNQHNFDANNIKLNIGISYRF